MKVFRFRLQRVLDYREAMEHWAQEAYLETRVARIEAERELDEVGGRRKSLLQQPAVSLDERRHLELLLQALDDEERAKVSVIEVLRAEEDKAFDAWQERKRDLETMIKLRDQALEEWQIEATRREQAELDEWAVLKRGA